QYGRYILAASSRAEGMPANLQGIWNDALLPPLDARYQHTIQLPMTYWAAEVCNLPECHKPLFDYAEKLVPHGRKIAKDVYNCRGFFIPNATDHWAQCHKAAPGTDEWIGAAAWLAHQFWWHYEYNRDQGFLRRRAYPF